MAERGTSASTANVAQVATFDSEFALHEDELKRLEKELEESKSLPELH